MNKNIKYIVKCETAPDFNIEEVINEEDWNLICAKCKRAGIACRTTHIVDDNPASEQLEEVWIIEPRAVKTYGKMLTALVLA